MASDPASRTVSEQASASGPASTSEAGPAAPPGRRRRSRRKQVLLVLVGLLLAYLVAAYVIVPLAWVRYAHRHPSLEGIPRITYTGNDIPGDPLNVALIGTEKELKTIMVAAKWYPADPLNLHSCLEIADASVLKRPYDDAPVSNLFFEGRKQDLAFEQPVGDSPRHRHHVRFWRLDREDADGRPVWVGSAVFDERVGLSRTTGQITHVTAPDVDTERDYLFHDLERTGDLTEQFVVDDFHKQREGRNGGGDPWRTDGKLYAGVIGPTITP